MKKIKSARTILLLSVVVLLFFTNRAYQKQSLSFHFVDEEDNIVLGSYLLKGEKLYSDLFSHHQPLAYIFSTAVQRVSEPNSLYLLIKRHREAAIIWSSLWILLLVFRFKLVMLLTFLIYEPLKIFLLGHLFLAESLAVYPLAYLLGSTFLNNNKFGKAELFFFGFCFALTLFLLSPLWPILGTLGIIFLLRMKSNPSKLLFFLIGILPVLLVCLNFISLNDYWYNAFYINFHYYIPLTSSGFWTLETLRAFISPLLAFLNFQNNNATLQVARILSVIYIVNCFLLIKRGCFKLSLLSFFLLGLANIRFIPPGEQSYSGFHIIPWFMALILVTGITAQYIWKLYPGIVVRISTLLLFLVLLVIVIRESRGTLFKPIDMNKDFYVNYSRQMDFGQAIKIMKSPGEKLMVVPDEWLIYWQADIDHSSKMVNFYAWMAQVPPIRDPLYRKFSLTPPTYFYCDRCDQGYFGLEEFFPFYAKIKKDNKETNLLVLKEKIKNLTELQKQELKYYNFEVN